MDQQQQNRQGIERIMRRAAESGHDADRVARALDHRPPPLVESQPVMQVERRSPFGWRALRRFARRP